MEAPRCDLTVYGSPCPNRSIGRWFTIDGPIRLCGDCYRVMNVERDRRYDRTCWQPLPALLH